MSASPSTSTHRTLFLAWLAVPLAAGTAVTACSGSSTTTEPKDAGHDSHVGPKGYPGLDAALNNFGVTHACVTCLEGNCAEESFTCLNTGGCKAIEQCALACVSQGITPQVCATNCIMDGGGVGTEAGAAAQGLDLCLSAPCMGVCN